MSPKHHSGGGVECAMGKANALRAIVLGGALPFTGGLSLLLGEPGPVAAGQEAAALDGSLAAEFTPFLANFCFDCHGEEVQKAELNLEHYTAGGGPLIEDRDIWEAVLDMIEAGEMPPSKKPQPMPEERARMVELLDAKINSFQCTGPVSPGRVTVRRLNRIEYRNTIRDLLAVDFDPADFPADEVGYGFDNIGDVLSLSPLQMEAYLDAAEQIAARAIVADVGEWPPRRRVEGEELESLAGEHVRVESGRLMGFYREGAARGVVELDQGGAYLLRVRAHEDPAGPERARMELRVEGNAVQTFDVAATADEPQVYEHRLSMQGGRRQIELAFLNNYNNDRGRDRDLRGDRNLYVDWLEVVGPLDAPRPELPESHTLVLPSEPKRGGELAHARTMLRPFMSRAYRRPASNDEIRRLTALVEEVMDGGGTYHEGIRLAVQAVLVSPHFLYRWEVDEADSPGKGEGVPEGDVASGEPEFGRPLTGYELAARLSYFLWSSLPDAELYRSAHEGRLVETEVLEEQVRRMLKDPKARALVENFGGQWLQTRNLSTVRPDPATFPDFDDALRAAMQTETDMFFAAIMEEDRSVLDFLDADFTFVNGRLARHYGMEPVDGEEFQRVNLQASDRRGGVLTQASVLTITSQPTRTAPVIRGKYILEQILGTPPPPPPPDVPVLDESNQASETASLRERLEQHRSKADCAGCHSKMDPLGFALENYDGIGRWRDLDGKFPIDPSGQLPTGEDIAGVEDLKRILQSREEFLRNLAEKLLTYGLGRGIEYYDRCVVDDAVEALRAGDYRFSVLVSHVVTSDPFRRRKPETN